MKYIAVLEYEHLDNGMFLTSFAQSLAQKKPRGIIIHSDSEYTERILQTGVMREEATIRAIKDLNHRLVALFADNGISTIALNGYQKSLIKKEGETISVDVQQLQRLPAQPVILLSALAVDRGGNVTAIPLPELANALKNALDIEDDISIFSIHEASEIINNEFPVVVRPDETAPDFKEKHLPENFRKVSFPVRVATAQTFNKNNIET